MLTASINKLQIFVVQLADGAQIQEHGRAFQAPGCQSELLWCMPSSSSSCTPYCSTMMKRPHCFLWEVWRTCAKFHLREANVLLSVVEVREDPTFHYPSFSFWRGNGRNDKANRQVKLEDRGKETKEI
jgi:hypothetical protein